MLVSSPGTSTAIWLNHESAFAPWQCFTSVGIVITIPGSKLTASLPSSWYHPLPAVQIKICPPPLFAWCICQLFLHPSSKVTLARNTALSFGFVSGFKNESPIKYLAYAKYFIGDSFLNPLTKPNESAVFLANVTFELGCRNNWHIHHAKSGGGQILICTAGSGWYQEEGKEAVSLEPGMVITIPTEVKHCHGAKADSWFSHIAVEVPGEETSNEWCEEVSDEVYSKL